jgi:hypothetical protein
MSLRHRRAAHLKHAQDAIAAGDEHIHAILHHAKGGDAADWRLDTLARPQHARGRQPEKRGRAGDDHGRMLFFAGHGNVHDILAQVEGPVWFYSFPLRVSIALIFRPFGCVIAGRTDGQKPGVNKVEEGGWRR